MKVSLRKPLGYVFLSIPFLLIAFLFWNQGFEFLAAAVIFVLGCLAIIVGSFALAYWCLVGSE